MAFKMKGFDPGKGTGMSKAAMKMAKKSAMQKKFPDLNKDGKITQADVLMGRGVIDSPKKMKKSPMKKMDPPATQAKIKKMIIAGIEKGKDDRDIRAKIDQMSDGSLDYVYNRKTKKVTIKKGGSTGFEGFDETDPDKG